MQRETPGADEKCPEVKTLASSKGVEYDQVQFDCVCPSDSCARRNDTVLDRVVGKGAGDTSRGALDQIQHDGGAEGGRCLIHLCN